MSEKIKSGQRGTQIMRILYEHGPLSIAGIQKVIAPAMSARRMQDAIRRLAVRGLIVPRFSALPKNAAHYYQLSQAEEKRQRIGEMLNVQPESILQHRFRNQELEHSELCATWSHRLKQLFPIAKVLREHEYSRNEDAVRTLFSMESDREFRPDLLILLPAAGSKKIIGVAVEIERSAKTHVRLARKLKKFASQSLFGGVLYACSRDSIVEALRQVYRSKVLAKAHRISHYGANFLVFAGNDPCTEAGEPQTYNSELKLISLKQWIHFLATTELRARRDANFEGSAERR